MKANELMISDWTKVGNELHKVVRIGTYGEDEIIVDNGVDAIIMAEPIPLTEEILNANGFELYLFEHYVLRYDDNHELFSFRITKGGVFSDEGYRMRCGLYNIEIQYVHELQHVLRLCGLTDLADNFKVE